MSCHQPAGHRSAVVRAARSAERPRGRIRPLLQRLCFLCIASRGLSENTCFPTPCPPPVTATRTPVIVCAKNTIGLRGYTKTSSEGFSGDAGGLHAGLHAGWAMRSAPRRRPLPTRSGRKSAATPTTRAVGRAQATRGPHGRSASAVPRRLPGGVASMAPYTWSRSNTWKPTFTVT